MRIRACSCDNKSVLLLSQERAPSGKTLCRPVFCRYSISSQHSIVCIFSGHQQKQFILLGNNNKKT